MELDEDDMHEFKSHRTLCIEEIPAWCMEEIHNKLKRSRQSISKTICSFLNTGKGGTIYLGILDDGSVKGIKFTLFQRDHMLVSLLDLAQRFTPPIPEGMLRVSLVPVLEEGSTPPPGLLHGFQALINESLRYQREHSIRTSGFCWCDKDALAQLNFGMVPLNFVVELRVGPWNPDREDGGIQTRLNPIYQNEEGLCYIRRQASNIQLNIQDVFEMTKNQVHNFWKEPLQMAKKQLMEAKKAGEDTPLKH